MLRDEQYINAPEVMTAINRCLSEIGETPPSLGISHHPKCVEDKVEKMTEAMKEMSISDVFESSTKQDDDCEVILQLREKLQTTTKMSERL